MTEYNASEIEHLKQHNYLLGIAAGWEEAAKDMLDIATRAFRAGEDSKSAMLREYARWFREVASLRRTACEEHGAESEDE